MPDAVTFRDDCGDELIISSTDYDVTLRVNLCATGWDDDDDEGIVEFPNNQAVRVAHAILEHAGYKPEPTPVTTPIKLHGEDPREAWNLSALTVAEAHGLPVTFRYTKGRTGDPENRRLSKVTSLFESKSGDHLVEGIDPDRDNEIRHYRLDWIRDHVKVIG